MEESSWQLEKSTVSPTVQVVPNTQVRPSPQKPLVHTLMMEGDTVGMHDRLAELVGATVGLKGTFEVGLKEGEVVVSLKAGVEVVGLGEGEAEGILMGQEKLGVMVGKDDALQDGMNVVEAEEVGWWEEMHEEGLEVEAGLKDVVGLLVEEDADVILVVRK